MGTEVIPAASRRALLASEVLDLHSDLHRLLTADAGMRRIMLDYAESETRGFPQWAASHMHPATSLSDLEPWLASLGSDLYKAVTYQVTAEMTELAEALSQANPDLAELREEDLPSDWGFMWLDKPVPRPSVEDGDREPLLMHAVSWAKVPSVAIRTPGGPVTYMPGVRIREWGWNDDPGIWPRPLHLMGQSTALLGGGIRTPLPELHLVHMIWILMGMEITASTAVEPGRPARKRAASLASRQVRVITLRRSARKEETAARQVDWSCSWLVRGHPRKAPHGGTFADGRERTWVRPYIKGPDGKPLRARDILYKLSR